MHVVHSQGCHVRRLKGMTAARTAFQRHCVDTLGNLKTTVNILGHYNYLSVLTIWSSGEHHHISKHKTECQHHLRGKRNSKKRFDESVYLGKTHKLPLLLKIEELSLKNCTCSSLSLQYSHKNKWRNIMWEPQPYLLAVWIRSTHKDPSN